MTKPEIDLKGLAYLGLSENPKSKIEIFKKFFDLRKRIFNYNSKIKISKKKNKEGTGMKV